MTFIILLKDCSVLSEYEVQRIKQMEAIKNELDNNYKVH